MLRKTIIPPLVESLKEILEVDVAEGDSPNGNIQFFDLEQAGEGNLMATYAAFPKTSAPGTVPPKKTVPFHIYITGECSTSLLGSQPARSYWLTSFS